MAIKAYNDAIEVADTTSVDCDYWNLSRLYGQLSVFYFELFMPREMLSALNFFHDYALKAGDTLSSVIAEAKKATAYEILDMPDSVIYFSEKSAYDYIRLNREDLASQDLSLSIHQDVVKGNLGKAAEKIRFYEEKSGFFDESGNIEEGRQIYYHSKGEYYLAKGQPDSAKVLFRKLLAKAVNMNEKHGAFDGLRKTYKLTGPSDSLVKYALLSETYNDSVYQERYHYNLQRTQELFDYTRHMNEAKRYKSESDKKGWILRYMLVILILILILYYIYYRYQKRKKVEMLERYTRDVKKMEKLNNELCVMLQIKERLIEAMEETRESGSREKEFLMNEYSKLKFHLTDIKKTALEIIEKKNEEIKKKKKQMNHQYATMLNYSHHELDDKLRNSPIVHIIKNHLKGERKKRMSNHDWDALNQLFNDIYPNFSIVLKGKNINNTEFRVCQLIRIGISPTQIALLLNVDKSYISNIRSRLHAKIMGQKGSSKEFDTFLLSIPFI